MLRRKLAFVCLISFVVLPPVDAHALSVYTFNGADSRWSAQEQHAITYCIESGFSAAERVLLLQGLAIAEANWESVADIDFVHRTDQDGQACQSSNDQVLYRIRAVCCDGRAMPPHFPRAERIFQVGTARLITGEGGGPEPALVSMLTHELGHVLGFAHEHARSCAPEDLSEFPGLSSRALTEYDVNSIMHYPNICDSVSGHQNITALDAQGAAALYGPATSGGRGPRDGIGGEGEANSTCRVSTGRSKSTMATLLLASVGLARRRRRRRADNHGMAS